MREGIISDRWTSFDLGKLGESPHNCYCLKICMGTGTLGQWRPDDLWSFDLGHVT